MPAISILKLYHIGLRLFLLVFLCQSASFDALWLDTDGVTETVKDADVKGNGASELAGLLEIEVRE